MKFIFLLSAIFAQMTASTAFSQNATKETNTEFDFWLGEWDLYWNDSLKGTNNITKTYNGVIHESFSDNKTGYQGQSWSVYDANTKKWKQTWVDNSGSYITLEGTKVKDEIVLLSNSIKDGKRLDFRMRFYNISKDAFEWEWSTSKDKKKTWTTLWAIQYKRKINAGTADAAYLQQQFSKGKNYVLAVFKKGPKHDSMDSVTTKKVVSEHLTYLFTLHKQGVLNILGPTTEEKNNMAGISIYNVANKEEAIKLIENDPAVKAGRIVYEVYDWFSIKGYSLE